MEKTVKELIQAGEYRGIVEDLPGEIYYPAPGLSTSGLRELSKSPAHYQASLLIHKEETPAMRMGTLTHRAILEPKAFKATTCVAPKKEDFPNILDTCEQLKDKCDALGLPVSGKKADLISRVRAADPTAKFWDEFYLEQTQGKESVSYTELSLIEGMVDAIQSHPFASQLFKSGKAEVSGFNLTDGLVRRGRADYIRANDGLIADLKVTGRSDLIQSKRALEKHIYDSKYHWQSAFYLREVFGPLLQKDLSMFAHVFIDSNPTVYMRGKLTHCVRVVVLGDASLERAVFEYQPLIEKFKQCQETGQWPCFSEEPESIEIPAWAFSKTEEVNYV